MFKVNKNARTTLYSPPFTHNYRANQGAGFYMIWTSIMKELKIYGRTIFTKSTIKYMRQNSTQASTNFIQIDVCDLQLSGG